MTVRFSALGGPLNPTHRWDVSYVMAAETFARAEDASDPELFALVPDLLKFGTMSNGSKITFSLLMDMVRDGCSREQAEKTIAAGIFGTSNRVLDGEEPKKSDAARMVSKVCDLLGAEAIRLNSIESGRIVAASSRIREWTRSEKKENKS